MLQPSIVPGVVVVGGSGGGSGAASPMSHSHQAEELLPLSTSASTSSIVSATTLLLQQQDAVELASLLDDSGERRGNEAGDEEPGSAGATQRTTSAKRHASKERPSEKLDRRRSRSHLGGGENYWNTRENFWWLWGGSQYSGLLCMLASSLAYSVMGLLVRLLAVHSIPAFETVAVRCVVIAALSAGGLAKIGHPLLGSPSLRLLLLARAVVGFLALSAFFYSIRVLPLRDATVLSFAAPAFAAIFASLFLDEKFSSKEIAGTACSLLGVLMVNQPPLVFGGRLPDLAATALKRQESVVGILVALLSAALGGGAYCILRSIGKAGEPALASVFVFAAFAAPASLLCVLLFQEFVVPSPMELVGMVLVSVVAFAAQVLLTRSLQLEKAGRATAMQYVKVVGTYVLGVLFWGERPSLKGAAGVLLISASAAFIAVSEKESVRTEERA